MSLHMDQSVGFSNWQRDSVISQARMLLGYWHALPGGKPRKALDPIVFGARLLPHLNILAVLDGGADFRYELVGGIVTRAVPRLRPGSLALGDASPDKDRTALRDFYATCATSRRPLAFSGQYLSESKVRTYLICLCLPLDLTGVLPAGSILAGAWFLPVPITEQAGPIGVFEEITAEIEADRVC